MEILGEVKICSLLTSGAPSLNYAMIPKAYLFKLLEYNGIEPFSPIRICSKDSEYECSTIVLIILDLLEQESPWERGPDNRPIELKLNSNYKKLGFRDKMIVTIERVTEYEIIENSLFYLIEGEKRFSHLIPTQKILHSEMSGFYFEDDEEILIHLIDGSVEKVKFRIDRKRIMITNNLKTISNQIFFKIQLKDGNK
jgi:hypothetical protein